MARTRRTKWLPETTPWFPYRSNHPYTGQPNLQQQSLDPELDFDRIMRDTGPEYASGYDAEEEEEDMKGGLNSDLEPVGPSSTEIHQETEAEGAGEEEEKLGVNGSSEPKYQDPSGLYHSQENDNGYDNSSDNRDQNVRCFSESEGEMGMMKDQENDHESGMNRLRVWLIQVGLGKYGPLFDLHEIDDEVLRDLTIEDLKDIGVTAVGSRWKIYCYLLQDQDLVDAKHGINGRDGHA